MEIKKFQVSLSIFLRSNLLPISIFLIALVVRLIYFSQVKGLPFFEHPFIDPQQYDKLARSLIAEDMWRFSAFYQAPGYAYWLAAIYKIFDGSYFWAHLVQMCVGAANVVFVFILGRRLFGEFAGAAAGLFLALYGPMIFYEGDFYREPFLSVILVLFAMALLAEGVKWAWLKWLACGISLALAYFVRENMILYLPIALYFILKKEKLGAEWKRTAASLLALTIPVILMVSAMSYLNHLAEGRWQFLSSQGGMNFYMGNNPDMDRMTTLQPGAEYDKLSSLPRLEAGIIKTAESSQWFLKKALAWIAQNPFQWAKILFKKTMIFFGAYEFMPNENVRFYRENSWILKALMFRTGSFGFPFGIIFPLAVFGALGAVRKKDEKGLWLCGLVLVFAVSVIAFHSRARYRLPVIPLLCILAGAGFSEVLSLIKTRPSGFFWKRAGILIGVILFFNAPFYNFSYAEQFPSNYFMAKYFHELNRYDKAEEYYHIAVQDGISLAEVHNDLGVLYLDTNRPRLAVGEFKRSIAVIPDYDKMRLMLGKLYLSLGQQEEAERELAKCIQINPSNPENWLSYGNAIEKKNPKEAENAYMRVIEVGKLAPGTKEDILKNAKEGLWRLGRRDISDANVIPEERKQVQLTIQEKKKKDILRNADLETPEGRMQAAGAYTELGIAYMHLDRFADAEKCFLDSLEMEYVQIPAHVNLGTCYQKMGKTEKALSQYAAALKMDPKNFVSLNNIGRMYETQKDYNKARHYYLSALKIVPGNRAILNNLARVESFLKAGR